jgi:hypothetical protein
MQVGVEEIMIELELSNDSAGAARSQNSRDD